MEIGNSDNLHTELQQGLTIIQDEESLKPAQNKHLQIKTVKYSQATL